MGKRADLAICVIVAVFGAWLVYQAGQIPEGSIQDPIGGGGLIRAAGSVFIVVGTWLAVRRVWTWRAHGRRVLPSDGAEDDEPGEPASTARALSVWVITAGYVLVLPLIGFFVATPAYLLAGMALLGMKSWLRAGISAVVFPLVVYGLFVNFLGVNLPGASLW